MQGNFFQNKEILNGWKEIMFLKMEALYRYIDI